MANQAALTHAELTAAQQAHAEAIAGIASSNQQVTGHLTGDLAAQARGDYYQAIFGLANANDSKTTNVNRYFQNMHDMIGTSNVKHAGVDADGQAGFQRLQALLNT